MKLDFWTKLVLCLTTIVAILQMIHLVLLNRLETLHQSTLKKIIQEEPRIVPEQEVEILFSALDEALRRDNILDVSGTYRVAPGILKQKNNFEPVLAPDITLVTQCTYNHLDKLVPLVARWQGPVSIAVYLDDQDVANGLLKVASLHSCFKSIRNNVTFSIISPVRATTSAAVPIPTNFLTNLCQINSLEILPEYETNYPINLLRNVARKVCSTDFIFVIDIDMLPNENLRRDFLLFANQQGLFRKQQQNYKKTIFVVPVFEAKEISEIPLNKYHLIHLVENSEVRPFNSEVCKKCQSPTNYDAWLKEPIGAEMACLYDVWWKDPWEPFYIAKNTIPLYDERFKQQGLNRISQVCELHVAGYRFSILNNAFLVHKGFKLIKSIYPQRSDQNQNRFLFHQFKAELKVKYIRSQRRC